MGISGNPPQQVDNPRISDLKLLRQHLQEEASRLHTVLHRACSDIGGDSGEKSWVGSTADRWRSEAESKRRQISNEISRLISEVEHAIAKCPEKVSLTEAKMYSLDIDRS
jgi:hypothetical protein